MKGGRSRGRERDTFDIANLLRPAPMSLNTLLRIDPPSDLRTIEDRRTYYPQPHTRAAASFDTPRHRLVASKSPMFRIPIGVSFEEPRKVLICVRRNTRRSVLFALKRTGKGAGKKKHRKSMYSDVRC